MAKQKKSGGANRGRFTAAAAAVAAAASAPVVLASEPGAIVHDYVRTLPDPLTGKKVRRVIEQHTLTPARAKAWQAELREQGFTDAEFVPAKK